MRRLLSLVVGLGVVLGSPIAHACGAAYPGGPMVCTLADAPGHKPDPTEKPPTLRVAASWSYTSTTIVFDPGKRADLTRHTVFGGTELLLGRGLGLRFGAGGVVAGTFEPGGRHATLGPGVTGFVGIAKTVLDETSAIPFLQLGLTVEGTRAATRGPAPGEAPTFSALDVRAAATAGKTIAHWLVPYVSVRAFGGPIDYRFAGVRETGTDLYHYQLGGGFEAVLPSRAFDVFVEGIALGERGVSAGIGTSF
jgi:hypothetical protein